MKKVILIFLMLSCFLISCTYEKGEIIKRLDCEIDSTIHVKPISIIDYTFDPASITILAGDTVKWTYISGTDPHTVTCNGSDGSTLPSGGTTWDSGTSAPLVVGNTYKKAILIPGTYRYICSFHAPFMTGTIIVKPRCH